MTARTRAPDLPADAWLVALSTLPNMWPPRLLAASSLHPPRRAWEV